MTISTPPLAMAVSMPRLPPVTSESMAREGKPGDVHLQLRGIPTRDHQYMRLRTTFDIRAWYEYVRGAGQPIAWCSAFAPAEALYALGIIPVYPENHAAMLGALSPLRDADQPYSRAAIAAAQAAGYKSPKLCSYALADLGVLTGAASPLGSLPAPDLFYACDSQCAVVGRWGEAVAAHFKIADARDIPHYLLKAPPVRGSGHTPDQLAGFRTQLDAHLDELAARFGVVRAEARLQAVIAESATANQLWQRCLDLARVRPAPWTAWEAFTAMAPIVIARGHPLATDFYRRLLAELEERVAAGYAAVSGERRRLLWDAIPIWPRRTWLAAFCAERQTAMVASTYTHSWWFDFNACDGLDTLVRRYAWNTMNLPAQTVLDWTLDIASDFQVDGIICHWNRSCGIWNSYVKRRLDGLRAAGFPVYLLKADMVDAQAFDESRISDELAAFIGGLPRR
jgi:benzoyl-CoA reductase/2-hydroxyglutaryl-CoA dehydratase subunit BcrC/BadD/HgdB